MDKSQNTKNLKKIKLPFLKRFFDVVFSLTVIIILFPIFIFIFFGLIIEHLLRLNWPLPFYTEKRVSQGKQFKLIKFNPFKPALVRRYQRENKYFYTKGKEHNRKNMTLVGLVLQKTYLDELPQFFTILIGSMTLVGPRPVNLVVHQKNLKQGIITKEIFRAGLTGVYQARKGEKDLNQHEMDLEYIKYVKTHSGTKVFLRDFKVISRTLKTLFEAKGY